MPYSSISESRIKKLDGTSLTLEQINSIARMADAIGDDGWAIAISNFKKSHHKEGGKWVKNKELEDFSNVIIEKESDGRWKIVAISTVAVKDLDEETFTVEAIDFDADNAKLTGDYPEFRMFHKKPLGIGKVEKMQRIGIFAVDSGHSYDDPFSLEVCEKILSKNDGKWRVSRGFYVLEASGGCPHCGEQLLVGQKHLVIGFRCPSCKNIHTNKGVLKDLHFRKTKTFDVTVTDIPCVPMTGVSAYRDVLHIMEVEMTKNELKQKLLDAGLDAEIVEERLKSIDDAQLKEFNDIPFAQVLKEFDGGSEEFEEAVFVLDESTLKEFSDIVREAVKEEVTAAMNGLEIQVSDLEGFDVDLKELPQLAELMLEVKELKEAVNKLLSTDSSRLKEMLNDMPRSGRLRIKRMKEEDMDEEEEEEEFPANKKKKNALEKIKEGVIYDENMNVVEQTLTEHLFSAKQ